MFEFFRSIKKKLRWLLVGLFPLLVAASKWFIENFFGEAVVNTVHGIWARYFGFQFLQTIIAFPVRFSVIFSCIIFSWAVIDAKYREAKKSSQPAIEEPLLVVAKDGFRCIISTFISPSTHPHPDPEMVGTTFWSLRLYVTNRSSGATAQGIFAKLTFYNLDGETERVFPTMNGRWVDGAYPWEKPRTDLRLITIEPGKDEGLDIAIKYPEEDECYAMNNKNWELNEANLKIEEHILRGRHFMVEVALRGQKVNCAWELTFQNQGRNGNLKPINCRALPRSLA